MILHLKKKDILIRSKSKSIHKHTVVNFRTVKKKKKKDLTKQKSERKVILRNMCHEKVDIRILNSNTLSQKTVHSYLQRAETESST